MKTPVIETERLLLRPMTIADAEAVFANWTSDPDVARFMRWERHKSVSDTREWLTCEEASVESDAVYNWGFVLKETGELIGSGGLVFVEAKGMYELGYNLMKKYWNQGIATEAARRMIDFGIDELRQTCFYCCHATDNPASGRVMTKAGFRYRGECTYESWNRERRFACKEYMLDVKTMCGGKAGDACSDC